MATAAARESTLERRRAPGARRKLPSVTRIRRRKWKLLFYVDEAPDIAAPIRRIFELGSLDRLIRHPDVIVVVQRSQPGSKQPTIRYVLGEKPRSLGEVGVMRARALEGFLNWQKRFPADCTLLVVLGHGDGWEGILWNDEERAWMTLPAFAATLRRARVRLDILDIDACHLAGLELVEFEGLCELAIASELFIPAESQDYAALADLLAKRPDIRPDALGRAILTQYRDAYSPGGRLASGVGRQALGFTLMRLSRAPEIVYHMGVLSHDLRATRVSAQALRRRLTYCEELGRWRDLVEFLGTVESRFKRESPHVARRAGRLIDLLRPQQNGFVIQHESVNPRPNLNGLLVELSAPGASPAIESPEYEKLRFERLTDWRRFIHPPTVPSRLDRPTKRPRSSARASVSTIRRRPAGAARRSTRESPRA